MPHRYETSSQSKASSLSSVSVRLCWRALTADMDSNQARISHPNTRVMQQVSLPLHPSSQFPTPSARLTTYTALVSSVAPASSAAHARAAIFSKRPRSQGEDADHSKRTRLQGFEVFAIAASRHNPLVENLSLVPVPRRQGRVLPSCPLPILSDTNSWAWPLNWELFLNIPFEYRIS